MLYGCVYWMLTASVGRCGGLCTTIHPRHATTQLVVRIDDDMEMALEDVRKGHTEMENYLRIVKGNRGVIVKTFLLLIAFIVLFIRYF